MSSLLINNLANQNIRGFSKSNRMVFLLVNKSQSTITNLILKWFPFLVQKIPIKRMNSLMITNLDLMGFYESIRKTFLLFNYKKPVKDRFLPTSFLSSRSQLRQSAATNQHSMGFPRSIRKVFFHVNFKNTILSPVLSFKQF